MECDLARQLLAFRRVGGPNELAPEDAADLARHSAACPACAAAAARADRFDAAVGRAMADVPVPADLRARLLTDAYALAGAAARAKIYRSLVGLAAAACGALFGGGVYLNTLPAFHADQVAADYDREQDGPEQTVRAWLAANGLPDRLPRDFDFRLYRDKGWTDVNGTAVPFVEFTAWNPQLQRIESAKVLFVERRHFKLTDPQAAQGSFSSVEVIPAGRPGLLSVIRYTTPTLDPFLNAPRQDG